MKIPALADADLSQRLGKSKYERQLSELQARFLHLRLQRGGQLGGQLGSPLLILFEGWDAAGKGGCIRRLVDPLDPRHYKVHQYQSPSSRDKRHHFLWRFWPAIPGRGGMCILDRTWYGRVLVERVENFCQPVEWQRAFEGIRLFEKLLVMEGTLLLKFFLHISLAEQQRRFDRRAHDPLRAWKLTEEDWRNRSKRKEYEIAIADMFRLTHSPEAPWTVIAAETKRFARIQVLQEVISKIEESGSTSETPPNRPPSPTSRPLLP